MTTKSLTPTEVIQAKRNTVILCARQLTNYPTIEAAVDDLITAVRDEHERIADGNIFMFCDHVVQLSYSEHRGCIRGAGHNGPHVFNQRHIDPPLAPVVLGVGSDQ